MPIGIAKEAVRQRVERKQSSWVWKRRVNELGPRPRLSDLYCLQRMSLMPSPIYFLLDSKAAENSAGWRRDSAFAALPTQMGDRVRQLERC